MYFRKIITSSDNNFSYIIGDEKTKECAVIDPSYFSDRIIAQVVEDGYKMIKILLTHTHLDHTPGIKTIMAHTGPLPIYISELGRAINEQNLDRLSPQVKGDIHYMKDNDIIRIGSHKITCIQTPGHHPASLCFLCNGKLITGDTLFIDAVGRTDLYQGDSELLFESLKKIKALPLTTMIYPGHDYGRVQFATLQDQLKTNPYLCDRFTDFCAQFIKQ